MPSSAPAKRLIGLFFSLGCILREQVKSRSPLAGFSLMQLQALGFIHKHRRPLMSGLADYLAIRPSSTTALVNKLLRRRLVKRGADPKDRRIVRLVLTPLGKKIVADRLTQVAAGLERVIGILSVAERLALERLLKKIVRKPLQNKRN